MRVNKVFCDLCGDEILPEEERKDTSSAYLTATSNDNYYNPSQKRKFIDMLYDKCRSCHELLQSNNTAVEDALKICDGQIREAVDEIKKPFVEKLNKLKMIEKLK